MAALNKPCLPSSSRTGDSPFSQPHPRKKGDNNMTKMPIMKSQPNAPQSAGQKDDQVWNLLHNGFPAFCRSFNNSNFLLIAGAFSLRWRESRIAGFRHCTRDECCCFVSRQM
ncbi:hypothetical protein AWENTII_008390 [Aspergillus wentii]